MYYRAVQWIATSYGYDVKRNPSEMMIATSVFTCALSPTKSNGDEISDTIFKFMIINDKETCDKIFPFTKWAGYLENGAPEEGERPVAYIAVLGDMEIKNSFEVEAGAAITNIMLGAYEKGIGSCWIGAFDKNKFKDVLSLPKQYEAVYLVALGYPLQKSRAVDIKDGDVKYYLDDENILNVPKRTLDEVII